VSAQRRGGGEYGNEWWQDGHLLKKQNSFDDFASCAEFLNNAKYTSPAKLTIQVGTCACSYNGF
jgi:prolyl oligopeptidase